MDVDFPVHAACQLNEPTDRIRQLVEEKENEADGNGDDPHNSVLGTKMLGDDNLPLHLACSPQDAHGNPLPLTPSTVSYLMEKYPDALSAMNEDGHAPLHVLLTRRPPLDLVRRALALSPPAVKLRSAGGAKQLPLHVAVGNNAPDEVIEELYLSFPTAMSKSADRGFLPLHFAAYHGATSYTFKLLLATNHDALNKKDEYGGDTPLHLLFKAHGDDFGAKYEWLTGRSVSEGGLSLGDSVRLLLRYGAKWGNPDPNKVDDKARKMVEKRNFEGLSVLEVAQRCGDTWKIPEGIIRILREVKNGNAEALDDDDAWAFGAPGGNAEGEGQQPQQANGDAPHVARAAAETEAANDDDDEPVGGQPDEEDEEAPEAGHAATAANGAKTDVRPDDEKKAAAPAADATSDDAMSIDEPDDQDDDAPVSGFPDGGDDDHAPVAASDVATNGEKRGGGQDDGKVTGSASATADEDGTSNREPDGEDAPPPVPADQSAGGGVRDGRPDVADDGSPKGGPRREEEEEEDSLMAHVAAGAANSGERDGEPTNEKDSAAADDDGTPSGRQDEGVAKSPSNVSAAANGVVPNGPPPPREDDKLTLAAWVKAEKKSGSGDTKKTTGNNEDEAVRAAAAALERDGQLDASTDDEAAASVDMEGGQDASGPAEDERKDESGTGTRVGGEVTQEARRCGRKSGSGPLDDATLRGGDEDDATPREERPAAAADGLDGDGKVNEDPDQRANQAMGDVRAMGNVHGDDRGDVDEKVKEESMDDEAAIRCGGGGRDTTHSDQSDSPDQGDSGGRSQQETDGNVKQEASVNVKQEAKDTKSSARSDGRDDGGSVLRAARIEGSTEQPQASGGNDSKQGSTVRTGPTEGNPESGYEAGTQGATSKPADERHLGASSLRDQNVSADTSDGRAKKESPNANNRGHGKHELSRNQERIEFEYEPKEKRPKGLPVRFTI